MIWLQSWRADPFASDIADRHYSRQTVGSPQVAPPGSCIVFKALTETGRAYWITSAPMAEYVQHAWAGAWICSAFRNEGAGKASEMIRQAVAATLAHYGAAPTIGMVTFIDRAKVRPTMVRGEPVWGWTFIRAGFNPCGETKGGLLAFQLRPADMPTPEPARLLGGRQQSLFGEAA